MTDILEQSLNRRNEKISNIFLDLGENKDMSNIDISKRARLPNVGARDPKFAPNRSN